MDEKDKIKMAMQSKSVTFGTKIMIKYAITQFCSQENGDFKDMN